MSEFRVEYIPRPGTTPEGEAEMLACIYRVVLDRGNRKAAKSDVREEVDLEREKEGKQS